MREILSLVALANAAWIVWLFCSQLESVADGACEAAQSQRAARTAAAGLRAAMQGESTPPGWAVQALSDMPGRMRLIQAHDETVSLLADSAGTGALSKSESERLAELVELAHNEPDGASPDDQPEAFVVAIRDHPSFVLLASSS